MKKKYEDRIPLYYQLIDKIEEKIENNEWQPGECIPSERELCEIYGMSRITVRNAIAKLENQGKLRKVQGKGTYVVGKGVTQNLTSRVYSFTSEMEKQGKISRTKLVHREVMDCVPSVAQKLGLATKDKVIYIERLRCDDTTAIIVEKAYFPYEGFEFLLNLDFEKYSLYKTLGTKAGIFINRVVESISGCELNAHECQLLECKSPMYGLLVKRISYFNDRIISYSTMVSKGNSFKFTVSLEN